MTVVLDTTVFMAEVARNGLKGVTAAVLQSKPRLANETFEAMVASHHRLAISPAVVEEYLRILEREGGGGVCVEVVVRKLAELQSVGLLVRSNPKLEMEPPKDIPAKDKHLVKCATGTDAGVIVTSDSTHLNNREMRQTLESSYSIKVRLPHEYRDLCGGAARA